MPGPNFSFSQASCKCDSAPATPNFSFAQGTCGQPTIPAQISVEDGIPIEMNDDYVYTIPPGYLLYAIIPYYGTDDTMRISKVAMNDEDVLQQIDLPTGWSNPIVLNEFAATTGVPLYIAGPPVGSKLIFFQRKIKMNP
jgi:hypothetical protein